MMARILVVCQAKTPGEPRLQVRGVFSQKKKLWEVLGIQSDWKIVNDVTEKEYDATYAILCAQLRQVGRVSIVDANGRRIYFIVEGVKNELRGWDTDGAGNPVVNPVKGDEKEGD